MSEFSLSSEVRRLLIISAKLPPMAYSSYIKPQQSRCLESFPVFHPKKAWLGQSITMIRFTMRLVRLPLKYLSPLSFQYDVQKN